METAKAWMTRLTNALGTLMKRPDQPGTTVQSGSERNFTQERESDRSEQMSADDRAWEAESRERDRKAQVDDERSSKTSP